MFVVLDIGAWEQEQDRLLGQDSCTPTPALLVTAGEQVTVVKQEVSSNCFDSN
jgi:hypothetical protein